MSNIKIVEVGPRDGLQNESKIITTAIKIDFINQLSACGFKTIETTAFVSPKWIPQMADHAEVIRGITRLPDISYSVLVPNLQGFTAAVDAGVTDIAIFTAASEQFTQKNIHCSIDESFTRFAPVCAAAQQQNMRIRGYISCALGCPYEGKILPEKVLDVAIRLLALGCDEISVADTIGVATPNTVEKLITMLNGSMPLKQLAVHFHDTYGQAIANIYKALALGITTIDSAVSGLGGCPYAPGASGNVATEDVVYLLHGLGLNTGIDLQKLIATGKFICHHLGHPSQSKVSLTTS